MPIRIDPPKGGLMIPITKTSDQRRQSVCVCVCVLIKLHITAQSGPVMLVIICNWHWSSQGGVWYLLHTSYENLWSDATKGTHSLYLCSSYLLISPGYLVLPSLLPCYSTDYLGWQLLDQPFLLYVFSSFSPKSPPFPTWRLQLLCGFLRVFASSPPSPILSSFPFPSSSPSPLPLPFLSPFPSCAPSFVSPFPVPVSAPSPSPTPFPPPTPIPLPTPFDPSRPSDPVTL